MLQEMLRHKEGFWALQKDHDRQREKVVQEYKHLPARKYTLRKLIQKIPNTNKHGR
jgi:hypothetical protein